MKKRVLDNNLKIIITFVLLIASLQFFNGINEVKATKAVEDYIIFKASNNYELTREDVLKTIEATKTQGLNCLFAQIDGNVKRIGKEAFANTGILKIFIPSSVKEIAEDMCYQEEGVVPLLEIDQGNMYFSLDSNGNLYNKCKTEMILFSNQKILNIPCCVRNISKQAGVNCINLEQINLAVFDTDMYNLLKETLKEKITNIKITSDMIYVEDIDFIIENNIPIFYKEKLLDFQSIKKVSGLFAGEHDCRLYIKKGNLLYLQQYGDFDRFLSLCDAEEQIVIDEDFMNYLPRKTFISEKCKNIKTICLNRIHCFYEGTFLNCENLKAINIDLLGCKFFDVIKNDLGEKIKNIKFICTQMDLNPENIKFILENEIEIECSGKKINIETLQQYNDKHIFVNKSGIYIKQKSKDLPFINKDTFKNTYVYDLIHFCDEQKIDLIYNTRKVLKTAFTNCIYKNVKKVKLTKGVEIEEGALQNFENIEEIEIISLYLDVYNMLKKELGPKIKNIKIICCEMFLNLDDINTLINDNIQVECDKRLLDLKFISKLVDPSKFNPDNQYINVAYSGVYIISKDPKNLDRALLYFFNDKNEKKINLWCAIKSISKFAFADESCKCIEILNIQISTQIEEGAFNFLENLKEIDIVEMDVNLYKQLNKDLGEKIKSVSIICGYLNLDLDCINDILKNDIKINLRHQELDFNFINNLILSSNIDFRDKCICMDSDKIYIQTPQQAIILYFFKNNNNKINFNYKQQTKFLKAAFIDQSFDKVQEINFNLKILNFLDFEDGVFENLKNLKKLKVDILTIQSYNKIKNALGKKLNDVVVHCLQANLSLEDITDILKNNYKIYCENKLLDFNLINDIISQYKFNSECFLITNELICIKEDNQLALVYCFCQNKKSINIYSGIHKILKTAFSNEDCKSVEEINFLTNNINIEDGAFLSCVNLKKLKIKNFNIYFNLKKALGDQADNASIMHTGVDFDHEIEIVKEQNLAETIEGQCAICLGELAQNQLVYFFPCGEDEKGHLQHNFHCDCVQQLAQHNQNTNIQCPMCRKQYFLDQVLFFLKQK